MEDLIFSYQNKEDGTLKDVMSKIPIGNWPERSLFQSAKINDNHQLELTTQEGKEEIYELHLHVGKRISPAEELGK